ncbi:Uncharacterised protein [Mycobacteroides abscessus subsp. abscessus]|nr:Uncharacterised protein [Mycobacteroides abscessus subsp. abscessus]
MPAANSTAATASAVCTSARNSTTQKPNAAPAPSGSEKDWNSSARKPAADAAAAAPFQSWPGRIDSAASRPPSSSIASRPARPSVANALIESPVTRAPVIGLVASGSTNGRKPSRKLITPSAATPTTRKNGNPFAAGAAAEPVALAPVPPPVDWPEPDGAEGVAGVLYPEPPVGYDMSSSPRSSR